MQTGRVVTIAAGGAPTYTFATSDATATTINFARVRPQFSWSFNGFAR